MLDTDGNWDAVTGSDDTIYADPNVQINLFGGGDTVNLANGGDVTLVAHNLSL